jgi:hypothetical protein
LGDGEGIEAVGAARADAKLGAQTEIDNAAEDLRKLRRSMVDIWLSLLVS